MDTIDFTSATDAEIAQLLAKNSQEFGFPDDPVLADDILARLGAGDGALLRFEHGAAVVLNLKQLTEPGRFLWLLFVDPAHRGQGLGRLYLREVIRRYAATHYLRLKCHKSLRPFYGRAGFRVEERNGDFRTMEGPYARGDVSSWLLRGC